MPRGQSVFPSHRVGETRVCVIIDFLSLHFFLAVGNIATLSSIRSVFERLVARQPAIDSAPIYLRRDCTMGYLND
jgi:hypothetical protein